MDCSVCELHVRDYFYQAEPCNHGYCYDCFDSHYDDYGLECPTCQRRIRVLHNSEGASEHASDDEHNDDDDSQGEDVEEEEDSFIDDGSVKEESSDSEAAYEPPLKKRSTK